jgi:hypothetical protein
MNTDNPIRLATALCISFIAATSAHPLSAQVSQRPEIVVADTAAHCPSVAGAFVVLLDPARGMLLLSGAPFPGGNVIGDARGGELTVSLPGVAAWKLDRAGSPEGQTPLWGARYPFLAASGFGCVAFDRERWSSEGDLVTYARWAVEEIYFQLPAEERQRRPDFRISDRVVTFRVEREGYGPFEMSGKEGSTLAGRYQDSQRTYLFMPFVLDEGAGRVAVRVSTTDGAYFDTTAKTVLGWAVAAPGEPGALADTNIVVVVDSVTDGPAE